MLRALIGNELTKKFVDFCQKPVLLLEEALDGKYATPFIKSYVNYSTTNGQFVSNSTLKINNILVYRFENSNASSIHEWFVYKNKVYTIYGWGNNPNFDGIAFELIESIK